MRFHYWSCSRFANWVRGTAKPQSGTEQEWYQWRTAAKAKHPVRYWMAETALNRMQDVLWFVPDQWARLRNYLLNRFVTETHLLRADTTQISPGSWQEFGSRLLPCIFDSFRRWVEKEYTLDQIEWAKTLVFDDEWGLAEDDERLGRPTPQAEDAREIFMLYWWWTVERPARKPAHEEALRFFEQISEKYSEHGIFGMNSQMTEAEREQNRRLRDEEEQLEQQYTTEDTAMLIRLITMRDRLWT